MRLRLLVPLMLALAAPVAAHGQRSPPPLPDSVPTQIGYIHVIRTHAPCGEPRGLGCFVISSRTFVIRDSLARVMEWKALLHEIWHQRMFDARIQFPTDDLEEHVVDLIATYQLAAMQQSACPPPYRSGGC